jgi:hypothetical protein
MSGEVNGSCFERRGSLRRLCLPGSFRGRSHHVEIVRMKFMRREGKFVSMQEGKK